MAIGRISGQMLKANLLRSGVDLAFETNLLVLDVTNSFVGIGTSTPSRQLHLSGTGALRLPSGTNAQRGSSANGDIRYNSDAGYIEGYSSGAWTNLTDQGIDAVVEDPAPQLGGDLDVQTRSITTSVTNGDVTITPNGTGSVNISKTAISAGTINNTSIGATTATTGAFTTLSATGAVTLSPANAAVAISPTGTGTVAISPVGALTINPTAASTINNTSIGATTATTGRFTSLTTSGGTVTLGGSSTGTIDNVNIGGTTAGTGKFTTLESTGNTIIGGNLTVNGTTTTIESTTLSIEDPLIVLAKNNSGGAANTYDQGLLINRGSLTNQAFVWDESDSQFVAVATSETGSTAGNITISSYAAFKAGIVKAGTSLNTGAIKSADGTASATIADTTGIITIGSSVLTSTDINGGTVDGTTIGASSASTGAFTTLSATGAVTLSPANLAVAISPTGTGTVAISPVGALTINPTAASTINNTSIGATTAASGSFTTISASDNITISADNKALQIGAGTDLTITHDGTDTTIDNNTGILKILGASGSSIKINADAANVDTQISGDTVAPLFYVDASADYIGIGTATPAYILDIASSTGAIRLPNGTTAQRSTASTGVIRFNTQTGGYEGSTDGSTWSTFAMGGSNVSISKATTTGDGSTSTFTAFFGSAPSGANNVMVYIDNVYQEPTENYTVSSNNITFTSAPHSGARIFALEGFDNSSVQTGGVIRSLTDSVSFTSSATTIMSFNANDYRSAELYVQVTDAANSEYSCMKAQVIHNGTTAFINTYGVVNTGGDDSVTLSATYSSGTVNVQAISTGGTSSAIVQYSLAAV